MFTYLKKITSFSPLSIFFILVGLDIGSQFHAFWGRVGVVMWIGMYVALTFYAIQAILFLWRKSDGGRSWLTLILLILYTLWFCVQATQFRTISGEATQEIGCQLNHFLHASDWGYNQTCLFGYPARQMIIPALPSLIFGRSVFSLHVGVIVYFLLSMILFTSGIIKFYGKKNGDMLGAFLLAALSHIYFFNHFMYVFEQSIFPLLFTFLCVGICFHFLADTHKENSFGYIGLCLIILIYAYTPSLAVYVLCLVFLLRLGLSPSHSAIDTNIKKLSLVYIVLSLISLWISFQFRGDILIHSDEQSLTGLLRDIRDALLYVVAPHYTSFQTIAPALVTGIYQVVITASLSILFIYRKRSFFWMGILWCMAVVVTSVAVRGYAYYSVDFRLHRALVIFPLLMVYQAFALSWLLKRFRASKYILLICIGIFIILGIKHSYRQTSARTNNEKHVQFVQWLGYNGGSYIKTARSIVITKKARSVYNFASLGDTFAYFYPSIQSHEETMGTIPTDSFIIYRPSREQLPPSIAHNLKTVGYFYDLSVAYYQGTTSPSL